MFSLFSHDSAFVQMLSRICDLIILNVLYLLTCLPLFTIGAANAALYAVCFPIIRNRDSHVFKNYFRAFLSNFRQATFAWLLLVVIAAPAILAMWNFFGMDGAVRYLALVYLTIVLLVVFVGSYCFPLISQFENTTKATLKNALILSLGNLPRTIFVAALNLLPWILLLTVPYLFIEISFLWIALYGSAAACMNAGILWKVFKPFYPEET